jgi:hypothetical protein
VGEGASRSGFNSSLSTLRSLDPLPRTSPSFFILRQLRRPQHKGIMAFFTYRRFLLSRPTGRRSGGRRKGGGRVRGPTIIPTARPPPILKWDFLHPDQSLNNARLVSRRLVTLIIMQSQSDEAISEYIKCEGEQLVNRERKEGGNNLTTSEFILP